jgi:hypothetical protein
VKEKEVELREERERLLALSRTESELSARLQGEEEKARSLGSSVSDLKEQVMKCQQLETSKSHLESQLRTEENRYQSSLQAAQEELFQERQKSNGYVDIENELSAVREELDGERGRSREREAVMADRASE